MERGVDEKETVLGSTDTETYQQTRYTLVLSQSCVESLDLDAVIIFLSQTKLSRT